MTDVLRLPLKDTWEMQNF